MDDLPVPPADIKELTLYTDSHLVTGQLRTRQRRITDVLNIAETFLVLDDVTFEELGSRRPAERAPYGRLNLDSVLFAVSFQQLPPSREFGRTMKVPTMAHVSVPPFRVEGTIYLPPNPDAHERLTHLGGRFIPITDATFWSDRLGQPRTAAPMLAFNHARVQILVPQEEREPSVGVAQVMQRTPSVDPPELPARPLGPLARRVRGT